MELSDASLVDQCRAGDLSAFEELYRRHAGRLYNLVYRMTGNAQDAEDLLQEIFLLAHRKLGSFKGQSALSTWLYRLAMNQCLDHLRSKRARMQGVTEALNEDDVWDRQSAQAVSLGEASVNRVDLERAIERLPAGCRAALLLHDLEGFGHREIAEILGIAEGTSKSQVHKARLRVRHFLTATEAPAGRAEGAR